ncbi:major facilitator superfamily domain-containing protein 10 [Eurytemora carolleeae]|uniref:major facilitator superfamily domain-containing protein 10 n=1 Tax=Eurytemora carolleeae TaxID=1294199 RepID=UPI000C75E163|nr:major facilitator superfamily domain-containing protein 10 [Eurytemora carolleeae]|eukprot:XP_023345055.1 major facilitator superfamily domain-containing protein 10-like [Eurytemora affinis]
MATLRSAARRDANGNTKFESEVGEGEKKGEKDEKKNEKKDNTTIVVFFGLLIDLLAFTLILPLFPSLISHYRKEDSSGLFNYMEIKIEGFRGLVGAPPEVNTVLFGGFLGSIFSFLQFIASPVIGGLSDRFGRKPLLLLSTAGISLSYVIWVLSNNFALFVLARIVGGISKGNVSLSAAIVTDVSTPANRGRGMALIGVAFSLGFLFGPIIGAGFSFWSKGKEGDWFIYPAVTALGLSLLDIIYIAVFFKESLPPHKRNQSTRDTLLQAWMYLDPTKLFNFSSLTNLPDKDRQSLKQIGWAYFLYLFLYSGMEFTLTFLTHLRFNFTSMQQGRMFLFIGIIMAVLQGGVVRRIKLGGEKNAALWGLLLIVPSFAIVGMAQSIFALYCGLGLYAVSTAFVVPCITTLVSQYGEHHQKGIIMGVFRSLGALGRALGPIFGSFLYWSLGPEISYALGGFLLLVPYQILKSVK